jgi:hypothetical protein
MSSDFFDTRDVVQVKYEMLRQVSEDGASVSSAAAAFGFSRQSYYHAAAALAPGGLQAPRTHTWSLVVVPTPGYVRFASHYRFRPDFCEANDLLRADLVIIDELGFAPLDDTGAQLLFRLVAAAYERRALGIGSHWASSSGAGSYPSTPPP